MKKYLTMLLNTKILFCLLLIINLSVVINNFIPKKSFHSDEQWTYAHANSSKGAYLDANIDSFYRINDNIRKGLFEQYTDSQVLKEYLTVQPEERFSYHHIYDNLKIVEHPPLYFILLHTVCSFFPDSFNKWYAGSINILLFILIYYALFKLSRRLLKDDKLALCCVALWGFSEIGIDTIVFLRMYILQTLLAIALMYEAIGVIEENNADRKKLFLMFCYSFLGIFTQYNSIFFSFFVTLVCCLILLKRKKYKLMLQVGFVMSLSVIALFVVFPFAYDVLFGSMRGRQVMGFYQNNSDVMLFLYKIEWRLSHFVKMVSEQFFLFNKTNYKAIVFTIIMGTTAAVWLKTKISAPTGFFLYAVILYITYLTSMPYMYIFHGRFYMSVMPFIAILTVMFISKILKTSGLNQKQSVIVIALLVALNAIMLDYGHKSPFAFRYTEQEESVAVKIKNSEVFINEGDQVIALHSMVYYLMSAKRIYITEDICNPVTLSHILATKNPIVLTYSSYMWSTPTYGGNMTCLVKSGLHKTAKICPSQRCYNVWEKNNG